MSAKQQALMYTMKFKQKSVSCELERALKRNIHYENETVALADGLHVGGQRPLLCQQRELRLRVHTGQGNGAAAVDDGSSSHGE